MSISSIKASITTDNNVHYTDGEIVVEITLKNDPLPTDYIQSLDCYIFAEGNYPMCKSKEDATGLTPNPGPRRGRRGDF